jgi:hypothetical protein
MSSSQTPPGAPDWSNVTLRTPGEIPKPTRFSPGWAAGIWCFVCAVGVAFTDILAPHPGGEGPILQALLTGLVLVLIAYAVGTVTWRLRGRVHDAGRAAFAITAGLMALSAFARIAVQPQQPPQAWDARPLLTATAEAMKSHYGNAAKAPAEAGIPAEVDTRLAAFDQVAAKEKDAAGRARYAKVRSLLALGFASDLRVGAAIDALLATPSNDWNIARDPAALAKVKAADAAFKAAADRRYADDTELANRIDADLQGPPFSAAEREALQSLLRQGAVAGRRTTEQVTALVELTRANEAAFDYLAAHAGTWRIEQDGIHFNNGLLARDYAPLQNAIDDARRKLRALVQAPPVRT